MSFCLPTACQEILQRYKIAFHLVKQWLAHFTAAWESAGCQEILHTHSKQNA
jgi:hypothetical protein